LFLLDATNVLDQPKIHILVADGTREGVPTVKSEFERELEKSVTAAKLQDQHRSAFANHLAATEKPFPPLGRPARKFA
jgi:hypothetical protein